MAKDKNTNDKAERMPWSVTAEVEGHDLVEYFMTKEDAEKYAAILLAKKIEFTMTYRPAAIFKNLSEMF